MKKKIKDLTLEEIENVCLNMGECKGCIFSCDNCKPVTCHILPADDLARSWIQTHGDDEIEVEDYD